jgi:hypothetical protein
MLADACQLKDDETNFGERTVETFYQSTVEGRI